MLACTNCHHEVEVRPGLFTRQVECEHCRSLVEVPGVYGRWVIHFIWFVVFAVLVLGGYYFGRSVGYWYGYRERAAVGRGVR